MWLQTSCAARRVIASASRSRVSLITSAQPHPDDSGNSQIRLSPPLTIHFPSLQQASPPSVQSMAFSSPPGFWNNRGVWLSERVICAKSCRVCPLALKSRFYQLCVDGRASRACLVSCTSRFDMSSCRCRVICFLCKPSNNTVAVMLSVFTGKKKQWSFREVTRYSLSCFIRNAISVDFILCNVETCRI